MYTPVTPTLLPSSMFNTWFVSEPGSINDLVSSPALKPILAPRPHWISAYMKNTNVICWSAAITTWNVFACENNDYNELFWHIGNEHRMLMTSTVMTHDARPSPCSTTARIQSNMHVCRPHSSYTITNCHVCRFIPEFPLHTLPLYPMWQ